jgi:hypothetical protein
VRAADLYGSLQREAEPDAQLPRVGHAVSLLALGEDRMALSVILEGLAWDPRQPQLLELLGDVRNREDLVQDALRSWREAFRQAPSDRLREKIEKAERELHAGRDYSFSTTAHFNVRYDGKIDGPLADAVMAELEQAYWTIADMLSHTPPQPITVVLYPSREFRDVTQAPEWVGGLYDGKIRVPLGGLRRLDPAATRVLRHELTHAVVHSKTRGNCPRWLHEGLAQIAEPRDLSPTESRAVAERVLHGDPSEWEAGGFSYPLALALTRYLESRRGLAGLERTLTLLGEGAAVDAALTEVYGEDQAGLSRSWAAALADERP